MDSDENKRVEKDIKLPNIKTIFLYVIVSWGLTWFITIKKLPDWASRGQFGDMFGSINSLFSGIALILVIYTIVIQRTELQEQIDLINIQRFETKFFNLLSLFGQIINSNPNGRASYEEILHQIAIKNSQSSIKDISDFIKIYENYYEDNRFVLSHYFRTLFHIVKFVDESKELDDKAKYDYVKILRAQLSTAEIALLCYNGLTEKGREFKEKYFQKYRLLANLDKKDLVNQKLIFNIYPYLFESQN